MRTDEKRTLSVELELEPNNEGIEKDAACDGLVSHPGLVPASWTVSLGFDSLIYRDSDQNKAVTGDDRVTGRGCYLSELVNINGLLHSKFIGLSWDKQLVMHWHQKRINELNLNSLNPLT